MTGMVLGVLALVASGWLARGWLTGYGPARPEAPMLNAKEQEVALAAADAMFPSGGVLPISGSEAGVLVYLDTTMRSSPPRIRLLLRLLLRFVEHGPWLFGPGRRLTKQAPTERVATLQGWAQSSSYFLRVVFTSLRTLVSLAYLADAQVIHCIGVEPELSPFAKGVTGPELSPSARAAAAGAS